MGDKYCRTLYAKAWIEDGIAFFIYTTPILTIEIAQQVVNSRLQLFGGTTYPIYTDVRAVRHIDSKTRNYLARGESTKLVSAGALLVNNQFQRVAGNLFVQVNKPSIPAKLFTNEADALSWLEQFKKVNSTT
jgi:hypothetical protein